MSSVTVSVDMENNAEVFWDWLRSWMTDEHRRQDPEVYQLLSTLIDTGSVEITDPEAIQRFSNLVESMPGYSDGPEHARTALVWQGVD